MASWDEFEQRQPGLAAAGQALFYQFGVGLAFLATVRRDGGPRVHPMCPLIHGGGLFAFILPGLKQGDLRRDGRYALHSFPCPDNEDAFYCTGRATAVDDPAVRQVLADVFVTERIDPGAPVPRPGPPAVPVRHRDLPAHADHRPRRLRPAAHDVAGRARLRPSCAPRPNRPCLVIRSRVIPLPVSGNPRPDVDSTEIGGTHGCRRSNGGCAAG